MKTALFVVLTIFPECIEDSSPEDSLSYSLVHFLKIKLGLSWNAGALNSMNIFNAAVFVATASNLL